MTTAERDSVGTVDDLRESASRLTGLTEGGGWPRLVKATVAASDVDADVAVVLIRGMTPLRYVARLDPGDVGEDEAARRVAEAAAGAEVEVAAPFTGRANLFSRSHGVLVFDRERLDRLNLVDEAITLRRSCPTVPTASRRGVLLPPSVRPARGSAPLLPAPRARA